MQCLCCSNYTWQRFCDDCKTNLTPEVQLLPTMPNIWVPICMLMRAQFNPLFMTLNIVVFRGKGGTLDYIQHIPPIFLDVDAI